MPNQWPCPAAAVPPSKAPELFVSMATGAEVQRAERALLGSKQGEGKPPAAWLSLQEESCAVVEALQTVTSYTLAGGTRPLDPLAVSVLVIKSLESLAEPLFSVDQCIDLLMEACSDNTSEVKFSIIHDIVDRVPDARRGAQGVCNPGRGQRGMELQNVGSGAPAAVLLGRNGVEGWTAANIPPMQDYL